MNSQSTTSQEEQNACRDDAIPQPWKYNPSAWSQRIPICVLAMVAFAIATYMGMYQWRLIDDVWDPVFGEQTASVLDSDVSEEMRYWFLVPDAIFGALAYLGDAIFGLAGSQRRWQYRPWLVLIFGIDVIPLGLVSVILVILQGTAVGSWCFLCLVTAVISLILVVLAFDEVWSCLLYLYRVWTQTDDRSIFWKIFFGVRTPEGDKIAAQMITFPETKKA
ncbi:vitamin K epoxide reductase family protein [Thalassoroseus pseudoceratinae]|uniref:vitamin K epoxide reductase family protein n=1 Tax=Thalassoroseus pseudoceratinae TaxID=2713176 RepID=UPI001423C5E8|nr:vitamin K epoxide reductase family protein [Thalassoroseus pseudoceratinae]